MSLLTEPLAQLEAAITDLESRVSQKIADAEKKDVPTAEEISLLASLTDKIKNLFA